MTDLIPSLITGLFKPVTDLSHEGGKAAQAYLPAERIQ